MDINCKELERPHIPRFPSVLQVRDRNCLIDKDYDARGASSIASYWSERIDGLTNDLCLELMPYRTFMIGEMMQMFNLWRILFILGCPSQVSALLENWWLDHHQYSRKNLPFLHLETECGLVLNLGQMKK